MHSMHGYALALILVILVKFVIFEMIMGVLTWPFSVYFLLYLATSPFSCTLWVWGSGSGHGRTEDIRLEDRGQDKRTGEP